MEWTGDTAHGMDWGHCTWNGWGHCKWIGLTSSPSVEVGQYPEDECGGYSDRVPTLLQHHLIALNNLGGSVGGWETVT